MCRGRTSRTSEGRETYDHAPRKGGAYQWARVGTGTSLDPESAGRPVMASQAGHVESDRTPLTRMLPSVLPPVLPRPAHRSPTPAPKMGGDFRGVHTKEASDCRVLGIDLAIFGQAAIQARQSISASSILRRV
jgi:hypothetical protein